MIKDYVSQRHRKKLEGRRLDYDYKRRKAQAGLQGLRFIFKSLIVSSICHFEDTVFDCLRCRQNVHHGLGH